MTDAFGGMPFAAEVNAFKAKIGCDQRLMAGRNRQGGTVVTNSDGDPTDGSGAPDRRLGLLTNAVDELEFTQRQSGTTINGRTGK